ncbi:hypothetical protein [Paraburkholderia tropica]|uniref:hypothetical protein n=1 Tax=Paraburkholderia tropica TaxID=92647 RepID=UPI003D27A2EC
MYKFTIIDDAMVWRDAPFMVIRNLNSNQRIECFMSKISQAMAEGKVVSNAFFWVSRIRGRMIVQVIFEVDGVQEVEFVRPESLSAISIYIDKKDYDQALKDGADVESDVQYEIERYLSRYGSDTSKLSLK